MPLSLDTPQDFVSMKAESASSIKVREIVIDSEQERISLFCNRVVGANEYPMPGSFPVYDVAQDATIQAGGASFAVPSGTYYTTLVGMDHAGANVYARVKAGAYWALQNMYGLSGTIT